jgi:hypothetical protein
LPTSIPNPPSRGGSSELEQFFGPDLQITLRECPSGALIWEIKSSDVTLILDEQGGGLTQLFAVALLAQLVSVDIRPE